MGPRRIERERDLGAAQHDHLGAFGLDVVAGPGQQVFGLLASRAGLDVAVDRLHDAVALHRFVGRHHSDSPRGELFRVQAGLQCAGGGEQAHGLALRMAADHLVGRLADHVQDGDGDGGLHLVVKVMGRVAGDDDERGAGLLQARHALHQPRDDGRVVSLDGRRPVGHLGQAVDQGGNVVLVPRGRRQPDDLRVQVGGGLGTHAAEDAQNPVRADRRRWFLHRRRSCDERGGQESQAQHQGQPASVVHDRILLRGCGRGWSGG